jgi:hypothetical protein
LLHPAKTTAAFFRILRFFRMAPGAKHTGIGVSLKQALKNNADLGRTGNSAEVNHCISNRYTKVALFAV